LRNLVTGGAGFIGSHLIDRLMENNEDVVCLDNYFTGTKKNIQKWYNEPNFEIIRHDVTEPIQLEVDRIWNLACPASPIHYQLNPIKTLKTCFLGTHNMLGIAKRVGAKILHASTSEIYGDPEIDPQSEEYNGSVNIKGIRSCYDEGKRIAETLCFDYNRHNNVDIRVARIFNTYGPRMLPNDGRVISNFIIQSLSNKKITIYGDGSQTRSFCYVSDMIDALIKLMNSDFQGPINIGNPNKLTIKQLAEIIRQKINPDLDFIYKSLPQDDPLQRSPKISLANKQLNWFPKVSLEEGLDKTIKFMRDL
tara:strand:+ start:159 stop:1079 length:921 start_codon:yes stop_codon:yes gene_type:complete